MRKLCYLLSIAGHVLLIIIALNVDFPIIIMPRPDRVITVKISTPPPPFFATVPFTTTNPAPNLPGQFSGEGAGSGNGIGTAAGNSIDGTPAKGAAGLQFPLPGKFSLKPTVPGAFSLSPASMGPGLPAESGSLIGSPRLVNYSAAAYSPGAGPGGPGGPGGIFLLPFSVKEKAVAAWTETVLTRIERNWFIPPLARIAFSGQLQITLTIKKNGSQLALTMDDTSLPESFVQSALQAIKASLPLPPLPENIAEQTFVFNFVFIYNG